MLRTGSNRRFPPSRMLTVLAVSALTSGLSGCSTIVETVLPVAAAKIADGDRSPRGGIQAPADDPLASPSSLGRSSQQGKQRGSVYVLGPTPGWERGPVIRLSGSRSPYFTARLFRGQCPALINLHGGGDDDPFGPLEGPPMDAFAMGNNLGISPDYAPFGRVELGGTGPQYYQWQPMTLFALTGDGCGIAGIRLIRFGKDEGVPILHR